MIFYCYSFFGEKSSLKQKSRFSDNLFKMVTLAEVAWDKSLVLVSLRTACRRPLISFATELCSAESHTNHTIKKHPQNGGFFIGDPSEIRTRVTAVKGRCPRPLDDRVNRTMSPIIPEKNFFCKNYFIKVKFTFLNHLFP